MKAFVIKNKEGKYYQENTRLFGELYLATFYKEEYFATKDAVYLSPKFEWEDDYEVVKITIAEGDLEQQLAEKDKEIRKQVCDEIFKELQENTDCYFEERKCNSPHSQLPYIWFNEIRFRKFLDQIEKENK